MAVLTSLTAAITTGVVTAAAVAEAAVVVGATLSVIGAATGNKELSYAGLAVGAAGGIAGLAGAAGVFDPSTVVGDFSAKAAEGASEAAIQGVTPAASAAAPSVAGEAAAQAAAAPTVTPPMDITAAAQAPGPLTTASGAPITPPAVQPTGLESVAAPAPVAAPTSLSAPVPFSAPAPPVPPGYTPPADVVIAQANPATSPVNTIASGSLMNSAPVAHSGVEAAITKAIADKGAGTSWMEWFNNQPDFVKATLLTQGAGATGGLISGTLGAMSASDRIDLERTINAQRQGQVDYQNRNAAFAPRVSYRPGLMNSGRA